jgi:hypothetical protein
VTGTRDLSVCFLNSGPICVSELLLWKFLLIWPLLLDPPDLLVYFSSGPACWAEFNFLFISIVLFVFSLALAPMTCRSALLKLHEVQRLPC